MPTSGHNEIFENLFVLELANNHWGSLERALRIVHEHAAVVRRHDVRAAIKLQFRDVDHFIHPDFVDAEDHRYIWKTRSTKLERDDFRTIVDAIVDAGCIPMATPFDEASVDLCVELGLPIIKLASSDTADWPLIERITETRIPVIVSSGGTSESAMDQLVDHFASRGIPIAINHCVSIYPSEDHQLELNQIDYFAKRYAGHVIGFSTHEYGDWHSSMLMSYAKGARTWERHIDIDADGIAVSPYCSLPYQIDEWFAAFRTAEEMCGGPSSHRRPLPQREVEYLNELVRGMYARRDLEPGYVLSRESIERDFYLAIPLQRGQISCRETFHGERLTRPLHADAPLTVDHVEGGLTSPLVRQAISGRGWTALQNAVA